MRALEKDRDKRYQSAWEMQYDIDQFLAENEFTPSNIHLANFLKQLFFDELEAERARLTRASDTLSTDGDPRPGGRALRLHLEDADRQALQTVAERNGVTLEELARNVLRDWLKYR